MFVYVYEVLVALNGKEPEITHALVFATSLQDAEHLLKHTQGVIEHNELPERLFSLPEYLEPRVVLERHHHTQGGAYHG